MESLAIVGRSLLIVTTAALILSGGFSLPFFKKQHPWARRLHRFSYWGHVLSWIGSSAAMFLLIGLFLSDAFAFAYVADRSHRTMSVVYKVTALWAGQEGSLLLWLWMQCSYGWIVAQKARRGGEERELHFGAAGVMAWIGAFFAILVSFVVDPFALRFPVPLDGSGMNPILQSYWMATHPVMLYLGFVGLSVPFAYALSSLIAGSGQWIKITRRWSLIAWTFLSVGILYGSRWAYEELGWGGYWGWDPVENASFMPWLVATAFIHSGIIEEKRGMLKRWNYALVFVTYLLTVFGTFVTRSGILSSVHAFVESDISQWFIGYMGFVTCAFMYWLIVRWEQLHDERPIVSPMSKESAFLVNNVVFIATTFAIFWGTVFPLIAMAMGRQVTVGTPYFNRVTGPLFWLMVLLMGIGPLISWRRASLGKLKQQFSAPLINSFFMAIWLLVVGVREMVILLTVPAVIFVLTTIVMEFVKGVGVRHRSRGEPWWLALYRLMNRSPGRYGGYVVHFGVLLIVVGIVFSQVYQEERSVVLSLGEEAHVGPFSVTLFGVDPAQHGQIPAVEATLLVKDRRGKAIGYLRPSKRFYPGVDASMGPTTKSAIYGTWGGDLYAVLAGWEPFGSLVGLKLYYNPLVWLLWAGGGLIVFGGIFSFWPRKVTVSSVDSAAVAVAEIDDDFRMGKVEESEYEAVLTELSAGARRYLNREKAAVHSVLQELKQLIGMAVLVFVLGLLFSWTSPVAYAADSAQSVLDEAPMAFPFSDEGQGAPDEIEVIHDEGIAVTSETMMIRWENGTLAVLDLITVFHAGDAPVSGLRLPLPEGARVMTFDPGHLEVTTEYVKDPEAIAPGETKRYALQYTLPALRWPMALTRDVTYPTAELSVMADERELLIGGLDLERKDDQTIAGQTFSLHAAQWLNPGTTWQVTVRPGPALEVPGWHDEMERLPLLAEVDRFPGDWLLHRIVRYPTVSLIGGLMIALLGLAAVRKARTFQSGTAGRRAEGDVWSMVRAVAQLDLAYESGSLSGIMYRRRRKRLMQALAKQARLHDIQQVEARLLTDTAEGEGYVSESFDRR